MVEQLYNAELGDQKEFEEKKYVTESKAPGSGKKRPVTEPKPEYVKKNLPPSELPPLDLNADILDKYLPADFKHAASMSRAQILSILHCEIMSHRNYDLPESLPDKLPKVLSTPFQIWLKVLARQGVTVPRPHVFQMWTRLSREQKQGYIDAQRLAIDLYAEFCQGGPEAMKKIQCKPGDTDYLYTKAGQVQKANRVRRSRCRSSRYQRSPADYSSMSHYQSFTKQMRVAICDELEGERPDYQTSRTLREIWQNLSEEDRGPFMAENCKDKWKYFAHWETWLRNRYCSTDGKPFNLISKLPVRPKTAY